MTKPTSYNINYNQLGTSQFPRFATNQKSPYKDAVVEDVIENETHPRYEADGSNVGEALLRILPDQRNVPKDDLKWIKPMDTSIREYPVKNEVVMVFYSLGRVFYTKRVNLTNKITESSWPGLAESFSPKRPSAQKTDDVVLAASGGPEYTGLSPVDTQIGETGFTENRFVRMLRQTQGDMILQGRFGNSIRLGSSLFSDPTAQVPKANLLFSVGQDENKFLSTTTDTPFSLVYEDINKDKSCIWMVTDEKVIFAPATKGSIAHLRSSELSKSNNYTGAQIFVNSDRVILNSKLYEISLFSKQEINLSALKSITIDSATSVQVSGQSNVKLAAVEDVSLMGKTVSMTSTGDFTQETLRGNMLLSGKRIFIGSGVDESQPLVLGNELAEFLKNLIQILIQSTVITSTGPATFDFKVLRELQSLLNDTIPGVAKFNSINNFTSRTNK
jgi:hypothetical protein